MSVSNKRSNKAKKGSRTPSAVRRLHRRLGIASALVIILLSITGIMLNHLSFFYSSPQAYVSSSLLLDWYGIDPPVEVYGYQNEPNQLLVAESEKTSDIIWADGTILINQAPVLFDQQAIIGLKFYEGITYLITRNTLHLFTSAGEKIESVRLINSNERFFDQAFNASEAAFIALQANQQFLLFDLNEMSFAEEIQNDPELFSTENNLNNLRIENKSDAKLAREFTLLKSKVLLDLHSGRIFGFLGPFVMDLFAIIFLVLAFSGLYLWVKRKYLK